MRKVIGIGETVLDIIFKDEQPIGAVPGGSVFNGIISLGRAGVPATFISETGNDRIGRRIVDFLRQNGVNTDNVNIYPNSKSPVSLAFLDSANDAEYIFYKDHQHDKLDFSYPEVGRDDVVMFGSYYAINPVIRPQVLGFLEYAHNRGAILYYDVNFRESHKDEIVRIKPNLIENLEYADIVRGSKEDFSILYKKGTADSVYRTEIAFYTRKFIFTQGKNPVELRAENGLNKQYPVIETDTVSTIGAGDNFNAGFVYGLLKYGITRENIEQGLTEQQWDDLIHCALLFSANCCKSISNSIDKDFGNSMKL